MVKELQQPLCHMLEYFATSDRCLPLLGAQATFHQCETHTGTSHPNRETRMRGDLIRP